MAQIEKTFTFFRDAAPSEKLCFRFSAAISNIIEKAFQECYKAFLKKVW